MDPLLRAALIVLAAQSVLGAGGVLARVEPDRRIERLGMVLLHGVGLCVAVAGFLGALLGGGHARPLILCAVGPLLVLCVQDNASPRVALASVPLVVAGLVMQGLVLLHVIGPESTGAACAIVAAGAATLGGVGILVRRRGVASPRARAQLFAEATGLLAAAFGSALAAAPVPALWALWPLALGAGACVGTSARLAPEAPPDVHDLAVAGVLFTLIALGGVAAGAPLGAAAWASIGAAFIALAASPWVRTVMPNVRRRRGSVLPAPNNVAQLPSIAALSAMAPLVDESALRAPSRPRVLARVPARRILDAALDRVRQAPGMRPTQFEVHGHEIDTDLDTEPGELAEALSIALMRAAGVRDGSGPVQVHLRGGAGSVTFEILEPPPSSARAARAGATDDKAVAAGPPLDVLLDPGADLAAGGAVRTSLARARLLVERNGGRFFSRSVGDGHAVQMTVPRRARHGGQA